MRLPMRRRTKEQAAPTGRTAAPRGTSAAADPDDDRPTELERVLHWLDNRTGLADPTRLILRKVFPDHWSFLLGEVALFCFVILVATGTFMTFFYIPDSRPTTYTGPFASLKGQEVSAAFDSVMRLSFEVRAGLLMRQTHHWTALIFVGAIAVHVSRVFFTGAFRRPRELNWILGVGIALLALLEGLTGYSLPDDLLSGTGLRIVYSALLSIPFIGPWAASLLFGGEFPTQDLISRFFVIHVLLVPGVLIVTLVAHIGLVFLQKHTQWKGGRAREDNVVGLPFWPAQTFRSLGLFFLTSATVVLIGGIFQINPVWIYGPFLPYAVSAPAQPDWYLGWLEGALRIGLPIEPVIFGVTIPTPFIPGIILPGAVITAFLFWPFIEARLTHDHREHNLLDWWWENPYRTATGSAFIALFLIAMFAGANDVLALIFNVPVEALTVLFQIALFAGPVIAWIVMFGVTRAHKRRMLAAAPDETAGGARIVRTPTGGFSEADET
jgi:quinol---cytochrome-c reductase cytochrome b subunit